MGDIAHAVVSRDENSLRKTAEGLGDCNNESGFGACEFCSEMLERGVMGD